MDLPLPEPIFAVDGGAIVALLVLIFTIVGWLVNAANSQNNPPPPARPQRRPRRRPEDERIQDEIEVFLSEVRGKRAKPAAEPEEVQLEVIEEAAPRESLEQRLAERRRDRAAQDIRDEARKEARRESRRLGHGPQPHAADDVGEHHVGRGAEEHIHGAPPAVAVVPPVIAPAMLTGSTAAFSTVAAALPQSNVAAMLRSRRGIQDAIIINELLAKPKALRNRPTH